VVLTLRRVPLLLGAVVFAMTPPVQPDFTASTDTRRGTDVSVGLMCPSRALLAALVAERGPHRFSRDSCSHRPSGAAKTRVDHPCLKAALR
jgi:hypothetical protein